MLTLPNYQISARSDFSEERYDFSRNTPLTMEIEEFWNCHNRRNIEIVCKSERATPNLSCLKILVRMLRRLRRCDISKLPKLTKNASEGSKRIHNSGYSYPIRKPITCHDNMTIGFYKYHIGISWKKISREVIQVFRNFLKNRVIFHS